MNCKKLVCSIVLLMLSTPLVCLEPLEQLKQKYSWPIRKPHIKPDSESLFANQAEMAALLNSRMQLIVELGSWLGGSTRFMLDHASQATIIAVDHWRGSVEHYKNSHWAHKLPKLYETFLVNCWQYKDRLIPMRTTTLEGLQEIAALGLQPDLIYLDAAHEYEAVFADLEMAFKLFPKTILVGDDWSWPSVRQAVIDFARHYNLKIIAQDERNFWRLVW